MVLICSPFRRVLLLATLAACPIFLTAQQAVSVRLAKSAALNHDLFAHLPQWSGGGFIGIESADSPVPIVVLFDREGREFSRMVFRIPGAKKVRIIGQARGTDGTVALVGEAFESEGRGANFLAILSAQGDTEQIIRTGHYFPVSVTITPDGSIWTHGHYLAAEKLAGRAVFRRWDRNGKPVGSFVGDSSFRKWGDIGHTRGNALVSSGDRVAFLCGKEHRYIEISLDGKVTNVSFTISSPSEDAVGLALTQDGRIFLSTEDAGSGQPNFYILDAKSGSLQPVPHNTSLSWEILAGADGNSLVTFGEMNKTAFYEVQQ